MIIYLQCNDVRQRRQKRHDDIYGRLAIYRLLEQQQLFCGLDGDAAREEIDRALLDLDAHQSSFPGTALVSRVGNSDDKVWILDQAGAEIYVGDRKGYTPATV